MTSVSNTAHGIEKIIEAYEKTWSVWKAGEILGLAGQTVHKNLKDHGYLLKGGNFTEDELTMIRNAYKNLPKRGDLDLNSLSEKMGRRKSSICRIAETMGLTTYNRKLTKSHRERLAEQSRNYIKEHGHPRGATGITHNKETRAAIGKKSKEQWERMTEEEISDRGLKSQKTRVKNGTAQQGRPNASWKCGHRTIGGYERYYRSRWEANYARYLQYLKETGEIKKWEHEPKTFWFEKIKRGTRSYLPDFRVTLKDGTKVWHEVKGWMDARSKTKLKRFAKYYPEETMILIQKEEYFAIGEKYDGIIKDWEHMKNSKW